MADGTQRPENGVRFKAMMSGLLLRMGRGTVENFTKGILSIVHHGKKQVVPKINDELLLQPAALIAQKIRKGEVSSVSVVKAYIQRITEVNPLINAVTDRRTTEALEEAIRVDELVSSGSKTQEQLERETPLLGVPFTSKEACLVKGLSSSSGLVCRKGMVADQDCDAVVKLRAAGAIPLAVTNTSEVCMWWETYNHVYGQTNNPYDTTRTVGGSSGGEAALIGSAGSLIGLGTDLGGSIRLPCFFSGIFGHKPSSGLVPHGGQYPPVLKEVSPYVVTGPMARYAQDLRLLTRIFSGVETSSRLELEKQVDLQSMNVYYMFDDKQPARTPVDSEIKEAMQTVIDWLTECGVHTEEVNIRNLKYGFMIWCACLAEIKDQRISALMSGGLKNVEDTDSLWNEMWKWISGKSEHTFPIILNAFAQDHVAPRMKKPLEFFMKRRLLLIEEMRALLGDERSVFLLPTYPTPAQHHGQLLATPMNVGYTVVFNAISLPTTQCPLGLTRSGLPMGMQIVTAHGLDRLSLTLAEKIEEKFGGWVIPPYHQV